MSREAAFRKLVSGQSRGPISGLLRLMLWLGTFPYSWIVAWRNRKLDAKKNTHQADVPVVSIGNLTTGGTGKTPLVCYICQRLREKNLRATILSRGYGSRSDTINDEAMELEIRLPDVPHLQDPDRVKMAGIATEELEAEILVLDDGFQHRRLRRDFDLLVIDATEPFGYDYLLPRGLLREPLRNLKRADMIVVNRCNLVSQEQIDSIKQRIIKISPEMKIAESQTIASASIDAQGITADLAELKGKSILAFCGIGNPAGFSKTLAQLEVSLIEPVKVFPDHHAYTREDIESLRNWVQKFQNCDAVLCTHKDLVKINLRQLNGKPLKAIMIGNRFQSGEDLLWKAIGEKLEMKEVLGSEIESEKN